MKPDTTSDRGEPVSRMEPLLIRTDSRDRPRLTDLVLELAQRSARFRHSLPQAVLDSVADLVRAANCYYSNVIEGHRTRPVDIERALKGDYSSDAKRRDLQLEAKAHISVQRWIDEGGLKGKALTADSICEVHRRFCQELPESLLFVDEPKTGQRLAVIPGKLRTHDVAVGAHVAVSPGAVPRFLARYQEVYGGLGKTEAIVAAAVAHHRLVWIHPFLDGNGRVARLISHATLLEQLDTGCLWSVARGLARTVSDYKAHLAACDLPRRNDLDGRGNLSEECLVEFTSYFLTVCIDQVAFMEGLMQPDRLRGRVLAWAREEVDRSELPPRATEILGALLLRGELPRADAAALVGTGDRQARRVVSALMERGIVKSETTRTPLRLAFPAELVPQWMPGLFPTE